MKIYIVMEIMSRELVGNLILAAILASRGHVAVILNQEDAFLLSSGSVSGTTVFHAKSLHYGEERVKQHQKLRKDGFKITSMDQENVLLNPSVSNFLSERFCEENLELATRVYTWNQLEVLELKRHFPDFARKIVGLGSPRVDSWGVLFRPLGVFPNKVRRQILLTPSVSMNSYLRHWDRMAISKTVAKLGYLGGEELDRTTMEYHHGLLSQIFFSKLALLLADGFPDCDVIIQPKKDEVRESWTKTLFAFDASGDGSRTNLHLDYSRILEESIHAADVVVNNSSTAGLTALIGDVPLVSFGPSGSMASQLGSQVQTVEEGFARVSDALAERQEFISAYKAKNLKMLGNRISISNSRLAAAEIVDDLETFDSGARSSLTARDFLLFLFPGGLRRMLSAVRLSIKGQRPIRAHRGMVEKISQARVNELLERIVAGIGTEINFRAVVAGGRNIIFEPKPPKRPKSFW